MPRLSLLLGCLALSACGPQPVTRWVNDGAGILDESVEQRVAARLASAEHIYGPQLVVVTTASLQGQNIEDYSLKLATASGIGDKARDDGLMLVIAPNERKTRIEVGTGLESSFTNAYAKSVIDEVLMPNFKTGRFEAGVEAAVDRLIAKMREAPTKASNDNGQIVSAKDAA
jgi:uncharacterized protein